MHNTQIKTEILIGTDHYFTEKWSTTSSFTICRKSLIRIQNYISFKKKKRIPLYIKITTTYKLNSGHIRRR